MWEGLKQAVSIGELLPEGVQLPSHTPPPWRIESVPASSHLISSHHLLILVQPAVSRPRSSGAHLVHGLHRAAVESTWRIHRWVSVNHRILHSVLVHANNINPA